MRLRLRRDFHPYFEAERALIAAAIIGADALLLRDQAANLLYIGSLFLVVSALQLWTRKSAIPFSREIVTPKSHPFLYWYNTCAAGALGLLVIWFAIARRT